MRPRELFVQVVMSPRLGCMMLARWTVPVATGMMDAVVSPTAWALGEAVAIVPTLAMLDGIDDLAVRGGEVGRALQVLRGKSVANIAEGGQDSRLPS